MRRQMWVQRKAPLIGRTPDRGQEALRQNVQKKKRKGPADEVQTHCKEQSVLPGMENL